MSKKQSPEEKYAEEVAKKIGTTQRRVLNLFRSALNEASLLAMQVDFDQEKPFTFDDYPLTKKRSDKLIRDLQKQILRAVHASVAYAWELAEEKNDELVKRVLGAQAVQRRRANGVRAFTARREQGLNLSDRVWKYTEQFKVELEMSLDLGLRDGLDAPAMSRAVREYLVEPNKLFRRVRDEHGHLHLSSRAKAYHPGQGVYRSSYKNALRLTATETNIAYRTADYERIQELDFVRGIEVCLSNNHTLNGKPFHCICDEFAGRYPKDFKFVGWHPLCRCYIKTILSDDPFTPEDTPEVTDVPQGLKDWVANNEDRIDRAFDKGRPAYWLRDNASALSLKHKVSKPNKPSLIERSKARHEARTPDQIEEVKRRWEIRGNIHLHAPRLEQIVIAYKDEAPSLSSLSQKTLDSMRSGELRGDALKRRLSLITHKEEVKKQWDEYKPIHKLADLISRPRQAVATHGIEAVEAVHSAVGKKLYSWEVLPLGDLKKKLEFEIDWVTEQKKYSTWEVARDAYAMHLREVDKAIKIERVRAQSAYALTFAKTTKSKAAKVLSSELEILLSQKWKDASAIEQKALELRRMVDKLMSRSGKGLMQLSDEEALEMFEAFRKRRRSTADKLLRGKTEAFWATLSQEERRVLTKYTQTYSYLNEPLRGITYSGDRDKSEFYADMPLLTNVLARNKTSTPMVVRRGVGNYLDKFSGKLLSSLTEGDEIVDYGFLSTAIADKYGFTGTFNLVIAVPQGAQGVYAEPFSHYTDSGKFEWENNTLWDGLSKETLKHEMEWIGQRGAKMRVLKIEGQTIYLKIVEQGLQL